MPLNRAKRYALWSVMLWAALSTTAFAAPGASTVQPGDTLTVSVFQQPTLSQRQLVAPDGTIALPLVGQVRVGGQTTAAAADTIAAALRRYVRDPVVSVDVVSAGTIAVSVAGDVKQPGEYALRPGSHVSEALAAAGGLNPVNGPLPAARVISGNSARTVSLQAVLRGNDPVADLVLGDHSTVYVTAPESFDVQVLGAVDRPGVVQLAVGERLSMAIALAGDSTASKADLSHIYVTRTEPNGTTGSHEVNLYQALQHHDGRYDPLLRKNDVVWVPEGHHSRGVLSSASFLLGTLIASGL